MKRFLCVITILVIVAIAASQALAQTPYTFIVETRATGQNYANFTSSGWSTSTGVVNAPGCTAGLGGMYSGTGTYFGPARYAQYSFNPETTGYYAIDFAYALSAGQINTAVNVYTGSATGNTVADVWGNTGGPQGVLYTRTMNMYNNGTPSTGAPGSGTWKNVTTMLMDAGTTYKVGLYGGYKTPYAGGATAADTIANRVVSGATRFMAVTPDAATAGGPADGATGISATDFTLDWTAGNYTGAFDIWFGDTVNGLFNIGTTTATSMTAMEIMDAYGPLADGITYQWRVDARNVNVVTAGTAKSFTTGAAVPEPGSLLALGTGLVGLFGLIRRRTH